MPVVGIKHNTKQIRVERIMSSYGDRTMLTLCSRVVCARESKGISAQVGRNKQLYAVIVGITTVVGITSYVAITRGDLGITTVGIIRGLWGGKLCS
jgi:hypothetical protein